MKIKKSLLIAIWSIIAITIITMSVFTHTHESVSYVDRFFIGITSLLLASGSAITYIVFE